jgi:uncharacterized protein YcfJ
MTRSWITTGLAGLLALNGCAVAPPAGPRVLVVPGAGKSYAQFQQEDATCRQYASDRIGNVSPQQAANQSAVGSAAIGTGLGAVAGGLLGSVTGHLGAGVAIGAGTGLLAGSAVGAGNAQASAADMQRTYDTTYVQCMVADGNQPAPPPPPYYP